jgi:hypothetical protein
MIRRPNRNLYSVAFALNLRRFTYRLAAVDVVNYVGHRTSSGSWRVPIGKVIRKTVPRGDPGVVVNRP